MGAHVRMLAHVIYQMVDAAPWQFVTQQLGVFNVFVGKVTPETV